MPNNQRKYWIDNFEKITSEKIPHTWDFQFSYQVMYRNQKFIHPFTNLVSNLGFSQNATHTKNPFDKCSNLKTGEIIKPYIADNKSIKYKNFLAKSVFINISISRKLLRVLKSFFLNLIN